MDNLRSFVGKNRIYILPGIFNILLDELLRFLEDGLVFIHFQFLTIVLNKLISLRVVG